MEDAIIPMLVDDPQLHEGSLPMFEFEDVAKMAPVPSSRELLVASFMKSSKKEGLKKFWG